MSSKIASIDLIETKNKWEPMLPAQEVNPYKHTMTPDDFFGYIGRSRDRDFQLNRFYTNSKKFSEKQKQYLAETYQRGGTVRVFGAMRQHAAYIADQLEYRFVEGSEDFHTRPKEFNRNRTWMVKAKPIGKDDVELWVFVFPSKEYVDQTAELIKALFDDFQRNEGGEKLDVFVQHFTRLEKALVSWTGFHTEIRTYIRYGEVVCIGHVDDFAQTLSTTGYTATTADWNHFGFDDMFGVKTYVSNLNRRRLVLVGFKESFWGSASGYYASSMVAAGARHILYGSKAATMIAQSWIGSVAAPSDFFNLRDGKLHREGVPISDQANSMLGSLKIKEITVSLTVPTVIGETQEQVGDYVHAGATCMDCENGHIARAIKDHTSDLDSHFGSSPYEVRFLPVHYITDYIHTTMPSLSFFGKTMARLGQILKLSDNTRTSNLTEARNEKQKAERLIRKNDAFRQIGAFFGYYAHIYGLTDSFRLPAQVFGSKYVFGISQISSRFENIRASLQAGYSHAVAIEMLEEFRYGEKSFEDLLTLALIAQKYGLLNLFEQVEHLMISRGLISEAEIKLVGWFDILKLKYFTQLGNEVGAREVIDRLHSRYGAEIEKHLSEFDQYPAFKRREKLVKTIEENPELDEFQFEDRFGPNEVKDDYHSITTRFFDFVSLLMIYSAKDFKTEDLTRISATLRSLRSKYYAIQDDSWTHAHKEKSAIATLFLEAAFYLKSGTSLRHLGLCKLYIAHLFNVRFGSNERSEGFGEIVWAARDLPTRDLLAAAMRRDNFFQEKFQRFAVSIDAGQMRYIFEKSSKIFLVKDASYQVTDLNDLTMRYDTV